MVTDQLKIYTTFKVLRAIKSYAGLEGMLEYMDKTCEMIESQNPACRVAVDKAVTMVDIGKVFKLATGRTVE